MEASSVCSGFFFETFLVYNPFILRVRCSIKLR